MPIEMQKEFKLVVGKEKLEKLGITLPEDLMNKATMIQYLTGKELHMNWKKVFAVGTQCHHCYGNGSWLWFQYRY